MWHKHNGLDDALEFDKRYCYDSMIWTCSIGGRFGADGTIKDNTTGQKIEIGSFTYEMFDAEKYGLYGRNGLTRTLSSDKQITMSAHDPILSTDGFYYTKKNIDVVIHAVYDEDHNIIRPEKTIPKSTWYVNCVFLSEVSVEPEWQPLGE